MYRIYVDKHCIHDPKTEDIRTLNPLLILEDNNAGSLEFEVPDSHPLVDKIIPLQSIVKVKQDGITIWEGRITEETTNFRKVRKYYAEGCLNYLFDTIQPQNEFHDTSVREFLSHLIDVHNRKVEPQKRFKIGMVTVEANLYRFTNLDSTLGTINDKLVSRLGGHLRVRFDGDDKYIDYLKDCTGVSEQTIEFGHNLLDFSKNLNLQELITVAIPLGAKIEEEEELEGDEEPPEKTEFEALERYTVIDDVNNGKGYVKNDEAVSTFGWIEKTVHWEKVKVPSILKKKAEEYIRDTQFAKMSIEIKAVDLHKLNAKIGPLEMLTEVRVVSPPHGLDRRFPLLCKEIPLDNEANAVYTLGSTDRMSLTSKQADIQAQFQQDLTESKSDALRQARENASQLLWNATHGHVVTTKDEQLIMDTNDKKTAKRVWRWNLNGLGYSCSGYDGIYKSAITMDGGIVGQRLVVGSVETAALNAELRTELENGAKNIAKLQVQAGEIAASVAEETKNREAAISLTAEGFSQKISEESQARSVQIQQTANGIKSEVEKKVGYSEVISSINQSAESVAIKASKIKIEGLVTANKNFQVLSDGSIVANNGTFTGNIKGSKITGSTINITDSHGCTIDLDDSGLRIDAEKSTDIFGHQGGKLVIGTTSSILEAMFSPICFYPISGGAWNVPIADGCNKFKFVWNVNSSSYVEFQTGYGAFGLTAWSSDKKLKKNIVRSEISGIDEIMKIPHFSYDWKYKDYHINCGYVAQDMEKINDVYVIKIPQHDNKGNYTGDRYQIDETAIIPVITKALQEVVERVERLENK